METLAGEGVIHYDLALKNVYATKFQPTDPTAVSVKVPSQRTALLRVQPAHCHPESPSSAVSVKVPSQRTALLRVQPAHCPPE
eukprot:5442376-Pyramimonas_sp.AAC.2